MDNNNNQQGDKQDDGYDNDPMVSAIKDLRGNEAFHRFMSAMRDQVCMTDPMSETGDIAIREEGRRSLVIDLHNILKEQTNE